MKAEEPFGYFRSTPFGWEDCAESDEGAKALYERPRTPEGAEHMTTHQPAALPENELRALYQRHELATTGLVMSDFKRIVSDVLAALQSQPAASGVSDADLLVVAEFVGLIGPGSRVGESHSAAVRFARAILALRPQAVPMTDEQAKQFLKQSDLLDMFLHIGWYSAPRKGFDEHALSLIRAIESHHGITAQGAQGEQA